MQVEQKNLLEHVVNEHLVIYLLSSTCKGMIFLQYFRTGINFTRVTGPGCTAKGKEIIANCQVVHPKNLYTRSVKDSQVS